MKRVIWIMLGFAPLYPTYLENEQGELRMTLY
jgi:hypothetical protein